jgi:hypothetical protein
LLTGCLDVELNITDLNFAATGAEIEERAEEKHAGEQEKHQEIHENSLDGTGD